MGENERKEIVKAKLKSLDRQRTELERKIGAAKKSLDEIGVGPKEKLVDREGFPRSDIDIMVVRELQHEYAVLQTDHKILMKDLEEALKELMAFSTQEEVTKFSQPTKVLEQTKPLFTVYDVLAGSPAGDAGFEDYDEIMSVQGLQISVNSSNEAKLKEINQFLLENKRKQVAFNLKRDGDPLTVHVTPKPWSGTGLLGCYLAG